MLSRALSRSCKVVLTNIWASKAFLVMPSAAVGAASGACVAFSSAVARSYHSSSSNSTLASFTLRTYSSSSDVSDEGNDSPPRVSSTASTEDRKTLEAVSHIIGG